MRPPYFNTHPNGNRTSGSFIVSKPTAQLGHTKLPFLSSSHSSTQSSSSPPQFSASHPTSSNRLTKTLPIGVTRCGVTRSRRRVAEAVPPSARTEVGLGGAGGERSSSAGRRDVFGFLLWSLDVTRTSGEGQDAGRFPCSKFGQCGCVTRVHC